MTIDVEKLDLKTAYAVVSDTYKGKGDIHAACREMRAVSPIYVGGLLKPFCFSNKYWHPKAGYF